jgi:hypothetical protein
MDGFIEKLKTGRAKNAIDVRNDANIEHGQFRNNTTASAKADNRLFAVVDDGVLKNRLARELGSKKSGSLFVPIPVV